MKRSKLWIARILCGVLLFGSTFSLTGCKKEKNDFVASEFVVLENWVELSSRLNNIIEVRHQDEEIVCRFTATKGYFSAERYPNPTRKILVKVNEHVRWISWLGDGSERVSYDYIEIYLLKGSKIVGYASLEITLENILDYRVKILKQVLLKDMISES